MGFVQYKGILWVKFDFSKSHWRVISLWYFSTFPFLLFKMIDSKAVHSTGVKKAFPGRKLKQFHAKSTFRICFAKKWEFPLEDRIGKRESERDEKKFQRCRKRAYRWSRLRGEKWHRVQKLLNKKSLSNGSLWHALLTFELTSSEISALLRESLLAYQFIYSSFLL